MGLRATGGFGDWLRRVASLGPDARSEPEAAQMATDLALSVTGMAQGLVATAAKAERPEVLYNRGVAESYLEFLVAHYMELPGAQIIATGRPLAVPDVAAAPGYAPFLRHYEQAGIRGMVLLPIRMNVGGELIGPVVPGQPAGNELSGVLGLYDPAPIEPDPQALDLALLLADKLSLMLCCFHLYRERELYKNEALFERSQQLMSTLTAGIAHDINNMLGAMLGAIQLLGRSDPEQQQPLLDHLHRATTDASRLTSSLLELSRVSRREQRPESSDVVTTARRATELVRTSAHPDMVLEVVPETADVWSRAEPLALSRILLNLLLNAVQALEGASDGRIVVRVRKSSDRAIVEVDDNGPGVPPEHEERIFVPYASVGKPDGTGVGLPAARALAERAGGTLSLKHRPGPGACFEVELPLASPVESAGAPARPAAGMGAQGADGAGTPAASRRATSVLLAEDESVQRRVFTAALEEAGFEVTAAKTGIEARALIESGDYDALVLDQRMPGMTGQEVLARARRAGCRTPALMVSGPAIEARLTEELENVAIISKPFTGEELASHVRAITGSSDAATR